ncbi:MAG: beta-ketoacyl-ACP synthase 3 [Corynebacteriales bacterium]|uniref:Beta-ketoacyl-[acyl-carrier-protein] synthase III n=1 Tax=Williamsia herbipolensis TaxID=1603258 RepID=A0AAU4K7H9_9NOCA|nr:beta-ketoacyl-ACP synthase 3 [Williamsia herbipolensis]MCX6469819.1 beta-ketoacyl-ACP synthase 3 [Mycobacteriales bacterium]
MPVACVRALGAYLPPRVVDNESVCASIDSTPEWISSRTGIETRRVVDAGVATSDVATEAARRALDAFGSDPVDMVVLATATPDYISPPTAPLVAHALGLGPIPAFDVSAACSGFLYGLSVAAAMISAGTAQRILFVCAETASAFTDPGDRDTAAIFADGAAAVILEATENVDAAGVLGSFVLGSEGRCADLVMIPGSGARDRADGTLGFTTPFITMDGKPLFVQAVTRMSEAVRDVAAREGLDLDDIALFVPHQANGRIIESVADELEIDPDRVVVTIDHTGNTIAASIPLALAEAAAGGRLSAGDRVMLTAFGAGASWGATTFVWPDIAVAAS